MAHFQFSTRPATVESIVAQGDSDGNGRHFLVDGAVKSATISHEVDAVTVCLLKAA